MTLKHPGVRFAVVIGVLFFGFWIVFMGLARETTFLGAPAIAWSQIAVAITAIALSVVAVYQLDKWENE